MVLKGDVKSSNVCIRAIRGIDTVFHFAANPEVRLDKADPKACFEENVLSTQVILEATRGSSVHSFVFASSSTVYGDATFLPTPEDYSPLIPVSVYGACKLASEALIEAYAKTYGFNATIIRLANIIGPRSNHGVIPDFIRKLRDNPAVVEILGDGSQTKSYLHIDDCVSAITSAAGISKGVSIYNVGSEDQIGVVQIADIISQEMKLNPLYQFTGGVDGGRGWSGDVKNMFLDTGRIRSLGWKAKFGSVEAVRTTVRQMLGR
jgi:UDP-glucose 4-epimerase